jgi:hypothetical protein
MFQKELKLQLNKYLTIETLIISILV